MAEGAVTAITVLKGGSVERFRANCSRELSSWWLGCVFLGSWWSEPMEKEVVHFTERGGRE